MSDYSDFKPSKLGEISRPRQWPTISHEVIRRVGLYPVYGANGVIGFYDSYTHEKPTVAITCRGSTCGEIHLTPEKSYITGNAMALDDLNTSRLDQRYLYHFLKHDGLKDCITGSAQPQIIGSALKDFLVWHPSLESQRLIARILDTLDNQIQKTVALIAKLEKVKEGLLHDLLTRGIDENGQLRPSPEQAPELYKESPLGLIPKPWDTSKLSELILEHNSGLYTPKSNYGRGTPMLGVSSLYSIDVLQNQELRKAPIPSSMLEKYTLQEGDIVYGESSLVLSGIAKTVAVGELGEGKGFEWHTRRIRVNKDTADPRFISAQLSYFYPVRKKIMSVATQTALTGMTTKDFFSVSIVLPHIDEQKIIFIKLDQLEKRVKEERSSLMKVKSLKKGLMDDLLTGRVRVTPLLDQAQATTPA